MISYIIDSGFKKIYCKNIICKIRQRTERIAKYHDFKYSVPAD